MSDDEFSPIGLSVVERYISQIFKRKGINPATEQAFWAEVYKNISGGIDKGFNADSEYSYADFELLSNLKTNAAVFSAFKNHSFKNELVKLLIDENGDVRGWGSFKESALKLSGKYNEVWLKTEYDTAVSSAHAAAQWQDYQTRKHLYPNLKYIQIQRASKRETHAVWHGLILPINHPFWNTRYPPNDFGCGCSVLQTDEPVDTKGIDVENLPDLPKMFNNNVGKSGKIFTEDHPYFNQSKEDDQMVRDNLERYKLKHPEYIKLKEGIEVSTWAHRSDLLNNIRIAKMFLDQLKRDIKIRPHVQGVKTGIGKNGFSNPEFLIDNKYLADIKEFSGKEIKAVFSYGKNQGNEILLIENISTLTLERIFQQINGQIKLRGKNPFKEIWILHNEVWHLYQ